MINKIENWSNDQPTEEGDYLVCFGDVETPGGNVHFMRLKFRRGGKLLDSLSTEISEYADSCKFAKLVYSRLNWRNFNDTP